MKSAALLFGIALASPAAADALLDQALANGGAYAASDWAYYSTMKVWTGGSTVVGDFFDRAETGQRDRPPLRETRVVAYDPSKPAALRTRVVRESGDGPVKVQGKNGDGDSGDERDKPEEFPAYSEIRGLMDGPATLASQTAATATYRFKVDPKKVRKFGSADIDIDSDTPLPSLAGRLVVRKTGPGAPYVQSVVVALPTGTRGRGNAAGKVKQLSMGLSFAPDPVKGVKLLRALGIDTSLQGLGLVTVDFSVLNKIEGYRYVGK